MALAKNVIIRRQDTVEPRRGYKLYGDNLPLSTDRAKQLFEYQNRIIRHVDDTLQYDDGNGLFSDFAGQYLEPQAGLRIKTISSNGNLYLTTADGIKKISADNASEFTTAPGYITSAGGVKALDVTANLAITLGNETGILPQDSAVAYRIVWAINDPNKNEILGVPSQRAEIYNPINTLIGVDLNSLLVQIDNAASAGGSLITATDYSATLSVSGSPTGAQLQQSIEQLATKLDTSIYFADSGKIASYTGIIQGTQSSVSIYADNAGVIGNSITLTFDGVSTIATTIANYNAANPSNTIFLNSGDGTQIPGVNASYSGTIAGTSTAVVMTAVNGGTNGNNITLTFNGTNTISAAIAAWNGGNTSNPLALTSGNGAQIPTAGSITLTGGAGGVTASLSGGVDATGSTPFNILSVKDNNNNFYTITLAGSGTLTDYFYSGQTLNLTGFTVNVGTINGSQTINAIDNTAKTITFTNPTVATGSATVLGDIHNYEFGNIITTVGNGLISSLTDLIVDIPTPDQEYLVMQDAISRMITKLQNELNAIIPSASTLAYFDNLSLTTSANVNLTFSIPKDVTSSYFYQIYRSDLVEATGTTVLNNLTPDDEMALVFEGFPTEQQLESGLITVLDNTPDSFKGANLYTNANSGEGIQNANEVPPFALDINRFKNCIFYANTKTKQTEQLNLLGVGSIITDYNAGLNPSITISDGTESVTYKFVTGLSQITDMTFIDDVSDSYNGKYFTVNTGDNEQQYLFYYKTSGATEIIPSTSGSITAITAANPSKITSTAHGLSTGDQITISNTDSVPIIDGTYMITKVDANNFTIPLLVTVAGQVGKWSRNANVNKINIETNDTAATIALKTASNLAIYSNDFSLSVPSATEIGIQNVTPGSATDTTAVNLPTGVVVTTSQQGRGEDSDIRQVLLSQLVSPAQAVDATARSLVRVINQDPNSPVYAFYLSGATSVPGEIELEARSLNTNPFYVLGNTSDVGQSFKPDISPLLRPTITAISSGFTTLTTSAANMLAVGQQLIIAGADTVPSINGIRTVTKVLSATQFQIGFTITTVNSQLAVFQPLSNLTPSSDTAKIHRVYYSKLNQPEAVPLLNFFDVGSSDKAILRIFPLRDSLFVFKEDGLYRVSGETAPFSLTLFDSSCFLIAPDSLGVTNNLVYCWTTQGVSTVAEAGVSFAISRPIDNLILPVQTSSYVNFKTATFGVGYESDNSYTVWTVQNPTDTVATVAYRFSNLTNTWSLFDKTNTCGFIHYLDDKMYLGAGDINFLEQERKDFTRYDYADREIDVSISTNKIAGKTISLTDVSQISIGDVLVQEQTLTTYTYNRLLEKLDLDPSLARFTITNIPIANETITITNSGTNNLAVGDFVLISASNCTPSIDGTYQVTAATATSFSFAITQPILVAGTSALGRYQYFESMNVSGPGFEVRNLIVKLAAKLDTDPGINNRTYSNLIKAESNFPITTSATGNPGVITATGHGLITGRNVLIQNNITTVPVINNSYAVTVVDANTFTIPVNITVSGTGGFFNTLEKSFADVEVCYNAIIAQLNLDSGATQNNYQVILEDTSLETVITDVNLILKTITTANLLDLFIGDVTIYKAIDCQTQYSPITMGDPLTWKHLREATLMFTNRAFTSARISFSTDLLPLFIDVPFNSDGNGTFGNGNFGQGFFGGSSNAQPLRTLVPRNSQRCRYLNVQFGHKIAREKFELLGITITGEMTGSTRAYRG